MPQSDEERGVILRHSCDWVGRLVNPRFSFRISLMNPNVLQERRLALAEKQGKDQLLLAFHQKVYVLLQSERSSEIQEKAKERVALWKAQRLCHVNYIEAWGKIINNLNEFKAKVLDDPSDNGVALRQNTPFSFLLKSPNPFRSGPSYFSTLFTSGLPYWGRFLLFTETALQLDALFIGDL